MKENEKQTHFEESVYEQMSQQADTDQPEQPEFTEAEQKKMQAELQKHFWNFKKRFKVKAKSELVAIIWEQGMQYKKLQDIAQELYEENRALKGVTNDQENSNSAK